MADEPKNDSAPAGNSGEAAAKPTRKMPKGRPFTKDDPRINREGRAPIPAELKSRGRALTHEIMDAISARMKKPDVTLEQLKALLESVGDRIGMLPARDAATVESTETGALTGLLGLETLTEAQRTKALDDFHRRQLAKEALEVEPEPPDPEPATEPKP
jgi:hypothetical protein